MSGKRWWLHIASILLLFLSYGPVGVLGGDQEENKELALSILTFFVLMLVIGIAVGMLIRYIKLPYTAVLIVLGAGLGVLAQRYHTHSRLVLPGAMAWMHIPPNVFLSVFLPVLLFAAAFVLQWHFVQKLFYEAVLLAGPGVCFGAALIATLVKYTFPYNWSWIQCLLFGAVLSATDPVAVAAILSEAALPLKLQTIVNLEALLNDGAAFVLYILLKTWAEGKHQNAGQAIKEFFRLAAGGPAIGLGFGICTSFSLYFLHNKKIVEMMLTVAAAYGAYIVADELAAASGVLAVVTLGLWFSYKGLHHVSRIVEETLHELWEALEYLANTLVFLLSGVIIAGQIYNSSVFTVGTKIQKSDWAYALLLWVWLTVVRFALFLVAYPLMNLRGYHVSTRECVVLGWSGLRGAVGLALGLSIYYDEQIGDEEFRTRQFFHIGCAAVLTILLQGTTMRLLLKLLGMTKPTDEKRRWLQHIVRHIEEQGDNNVEYAKHDRILGEPEWADVQSYVRLREIASKSLLSALFGQSRLRALFPCFKPKLGEGNDVVTEARGIYDASKQTTRMQRLEEKRSRFLKAVKQAYLNLFQDHFLGSTHILALRTAVDADSDDLETPLGDWKKLGLSHQFKWTKNPIACFSSWLLAHSTILGRDLTHHIGVVLLSSFQDSASTALAFCNAHQFAAYHMKNMHAETQSSHNKDIEAMEQENPENKETFPQKSPLRYSPEEESVTEQVLRESRKQVADAFNFVMDIKEGWPEALRGIKTSQLAREILNDKETYIQDMKHSGLLGEEEAEELSELVYHNLRTLVLAAPHYSVPTPSQLLHENDAFKSIPMDTFHKQIWPKVKMTSIEADKIIGLDSGVIPVLLRGKVCMIPNGKGTHQYLVNGKLNQQYYERALLGGGHPSSNGSIFGWGLLNSGIPCPWTHVAMTSCLIAFVPSHLILGFEARDARVRAEIWRSLGVAISIWQSPNELSSGFNAHAQIFKDAQPRHLQPGDLFGDHVTTFVLLSGSFQKNDIVNGVNTSRIVTEPGIYTTNGKNRPLFKALTILKVLILPVEKPKRSRQIGANKAPGNSSSDSNGSSSQASHVQEIEMQEFKHEDPFKGGANQRVSFESSEWTPSRTEAALIQKKCRGLAHGLHIQTLAKQGANEDLVL